MAVFIHVPSPEYGGQERCEVEWLAAEVAPDLRRTTNPLLMELARWLENRGAPGEVGEAAWLIPEMELWEQDEVEWANGFARLELMEKSLAAYMHCGPGRRFEGALPLSELYLALYNGVNLSKSPWIGA